MTILQKSHGYTTGDAMKLSHKQRLTRNHMSELNHQGVIVIRNPFKALISHRHLDIGGHTGYAPKSHFLGKGECTKNLHITYYENVKRDPVGEMEKILKYLNLRVDEERLACVGQHTDGLFKRKPSKNVPLDFNPFTQELKDLVYEAIDSVNEILKEKGKDGLPLSLYEFYDMLEARTTRYMRKRRKGPS
ncbi:hypothetical protein SK128_024683 [Halocaridina rubra]|uniref:Sulfotransferase n=1 Tax=Halocaridina rubra TaxID=373956 RepID=A0AAN8WU00_HALRR